MDERKLELKVGAFLLAVVAAVLGLLWLMDELPTTFGRSLTVDFGHTGNVTKGSPVKMGGVPVGRVDKIALLPDRRDEAGEPLPVRMELSLDAKARAALRADAAVTVATQGPLGEPYLELYPGSANAPALEKDQIVRGLDAPRLDLVAYRLSRFLESASRVLDEDPRALSTLVGGVSSLSRTLDGMLSENRDQVRELAGELSAAAKDLRALSLAARTQLEPGGKGSALLDDAAATAHALRQSVPPLSDKASTTLNGLANLAGTLTAEDGAHLKVAIERYASAGERLDRLAERGEKILARIEAGEGSAGKAIRDPKLYDDLRDLISDLKKHPWKMMWKD